MKRYVALFIIMVLLTCGISAIPIKADDTKKSSIVYNTVKFIITDDIDVNKEQTLDVTFRDKYNQPIKDKDGKIISFIYKFKVRDYEIKEGRDVSFHGSNYYKYIELTVPIDLSIIDKATEGTIQLANEITTEEESSNITYNGIKTDKEYKVNATTTEKEEYHNVLSDITIWIIGTACCVLFMILILYVFKLAVDKKWIPEYVMNNLSSVFNEFTINDKDDNNINSTTEYNDDEEEIEYFVPKKIIYICPACGQNYINYKLDGFIPHCTNCGSIMNKAGEV